jgi:two-component system response regulator
MPAIRVLVVKDNADDQELLRRQLLKTQVGDNVHFTSDPRAALRLFQGPESDKIKQELVAIFLDVNLPHMSGLDLLRLIRTIAGMDQVPVMVMTSSPRPETRTICAELGVRALVEKPISFSDFSRVLAPLFHQPR